MTDPLVARLAAESAIRRLISSYCDAVGRRDPDAVGLLFAPDAQVSIADMPPRVGRQEIVDGFRRTASGFSFLHQKCDTGLIDVDGDAARARLGVLEINRSIDAGSMNMIFGVYEDEYRRLEEGWRFHRRRFTLEYRVVLPALELQPFAAAAPLFEFAPSSPAPNA
jgi:ketosteroid isomerase-like protein